MLIIQGTGSQHVVHGKKHILHSHSPIIDTRWEHNDGFADEHRRSTRALVVLTGLEYQLPTPTYVPTFGAPIILRRLHGRPLECVVSNSPSLSVCWIQWRKNYASILILNRIAPLTTLLCNFLFRRNIMAILKTAAWQHTDSSPATPNGFANIPAAYPKTQWPTWMMPSWALKTQNTRLDRYIPSRKWVVV